MEIERTMRDDLPSVLEIYRQARAYQYQQTGYGWPEFPVSFIEAEIREKRHFRVLDEQGEIAGVLSVVYTEPVIWNDSGGKEALYLHRMAIPNRYRGKSIAAKMIAWAVTEAGKQNRKYVRLDTWANNEMLTAYYQRLGFALIGKKQLPPKSDLPDHYHNIEVNLFEIRL